MKKCLKKMQDKLDDLTQDYGHLFFLSWMIVILIVAIIIMFKI